MSFAIGPSPRQLQKVPGLYRVQAHDELQYFPVPVEAPVGRYLEVRASTIRIGTLSQLSQKSCTDV